MKLKDILVENKKEELIKDIIDAYVKDETILRPKLVRVTKREITDFGIDKIGKGVATGDKILMIMKLADYVKEYGYKK